MNRRLGLLITLVSTLCLASPTAAGAMMAHRHRASVHVRHQAINRPVHTRRKHLCRVHRAHHKHAKHASCRKHKKAHHKRRHTHKRAPHGTRGSRPATASRDCPNANLTPKDGNLDSAVAATLCLVNDERARFGEPPLLEDAHLASAAAGHSRDMDARDYFEHVSPGGQTLLMRVQASGFIPSARVGYTLGENIAWGTLWLGTPRAIVQAWMASQGHRANILNRAYRYSGIGIDAVLPHSRSNGQAGGMYTQDFGTIIK